MSNETAEQDKPASAAEKPAPAGKEYNASSITVLGGIASRPRTPRNVHRRYGSSGLHQLLYEAVDNCIDEAMAGPLHRHLGSRCTRTTRIAVEDNGRGIPVAETEKESLKKQGRDVSALEVVMTVLHAGGKFDKEHL